MRGEFQVVFRIVDEGKGGEGRFCVERIDGGLISNDGTVFISYACEDAATKRMQELNNLSEAKNPQ